jgi:hypothetical protein
MLLGHFSAAQAGISGLVSHPAVMPLLSRQLSLTGFGRRLSA